MGNLFLNGESRKRELVMIYCLEDDQSIRDIEIYALKQTGYEAEGFSNSADFFAAVKKEKPELVILDIMLPDEDGVTVLKKIRAREETKNIPVIMASAKGSEFDKINSLDLGADDYLAKPFGMMEMVSRVRAVLRRFTKETHVEKEMKLGSISLIPNRHEVYVDNQKIDLTLKEYELLKLLITYPGIVFTREQLLNSIWGTEYDGETRTVDVHVRTLRQKLGDAQNHISTIRGVGYRFEENISYD